MTNEATKKDVISPVVKKGSKQPAEEFVLAVTDGTSEDKIARDDAVRGYTSTGEMSDSFKLKLYNRIESERQMHRLATLYFNARQFVLIFMPSATLSMISGMLAFLSTSELMQNGNTAKILSLVVGSFSVLSAFIQTISNQLKWDSRAQMHEAAATDLKMIADAIDLWAVFSGDTDKPEKLPAFLKTFKERYTQIMEGCKSAIPLVISQAFKTFETRLTQDPRFRKIESRYGQVDEVEMIMAAAYNELYLAFSESYQFPLGTPSAEHVISVALKKCERNHLLPKDRDATTEHEIGRQSIEDLNEGQHNKDLYGQYGTFADGIDEKVDLISAQERAAEVP